MFLLSGGCCDGSVPNCYKLGEVIPGQTMLLLGEVGGAPFYLGHQEFAYYASSQLTLDVQPGGGGDFSSTAARDVPSSPARGCSRREPAPRPRFARPTPTHEPRISFCIDA
jgi:uncharacterized protein (DUF779 family)